MLRIGFSTIILIFLMGCSTDDTTNPRTIVNGKYDNKAIGIILQFPLSWSIKTDQKSGNINLDVVALSPPINGVYPNANVLYNPHTGTNDVRTLLDQVKSTLQSLYPDLSGYSDSVFVENSAPVGKIKYGATINGNRLSVMQYIVINRNHDIVISYGDLESHFDSNSDIRSIDSSMIIY